MKPIIASALLALGVAFAAPAGATPFTPSSQVIAGQTDEAILRVKWKHGHYGGGYGNRGRHGGWGGGYGGGRGHGYGGGGWGGGDWGRGYGGGGWGDDHRH